MKRDFGSRLKSLLENQNFNQKEFADKIGITEATLSRYINNLIVPKIEIVVKMADILNVSIDFLTGNERELSESEELYVLKHLLMKKGFMKEEKDLSNEELNKLLTFIGKNKDLFKDNSKK